MCAPGKGWRACVPICPDRTTSDRPPTPARRVPLQARYLPDLPDLPAFLARFFPPASPGPALVCCNPRAESSGLGWPGPCMFAPWYVRCTCESLGMGVAFCKLRASWWGGAEQTGGCAPKRERDRSRFVKDPPLSARIFVLSNMLVVVNFLCRCLDRDSEGVLHS